MSARAWVVGAVAGLALLTGCQTASTDAKAPETVQAWETEPWIVGCVEYVMEDPSIREDIAAQVCITEWEEAGRP